MPNFTRLLLFSALFSLLTARAYSDGFNSVFSKDGNEVIAVGDYGNLFRSWDGGSNWGSYPLGSVNQNCVTGLNQSFWIAADGGVFYYTSNNGSVWNTLSLAGGQDLNSVFFIDANIGWIAGNTGTIFKSVNGGANWTAQTSPVNVNLNSVRFTSTTNGVACGNNGTVLYTTNGGTNWLQYTTPTNKNLLSIDQKTSTIIAGAADGIVIKSVNNGSNWSVIDYKIVTKSDINSVFMLDASTYYSCGGGGFIRKSTNAGVSFTFQQNPMMANLVSIYFYNNLKGWAVSSLNNAIIRTSDGGSTWLLPAGTTVSYSWTQKQSGSGNIGNGFCLHPTNKNGIFIAMGNQIYRSLNKGENWTLIATLPTTPAHSFYVSPLDSNLMLAATGSSSGRVQRSTNYGQTWTQTFSGNLTSYGMPLEMDPNDPNVCYLGPDNSVMLKSTNFGLNWSNWSVNTFRSPCDLVVLYDNPNIMYVGDGTTGSGSGELFNSTNGGVNWTSIHTVSGSEIPMISITSLDPTLAFHTAWSSGGFWRTYNQWQNFLQVATTGSAWGTDIAKDDPTAVAFVIYGTTAYVSSNSGSNFVSSNVGSSPNAGVLFFDKGTLFSQQGGGVYKMTVTYSVITSNNLITSETPGEFGLKQNYPNPFNPATTIQYLVSKSSFVEVKLFDILGREVNTLMSREQSPGKYELRVDGSNLTSGIYFYSLFADGFRIDTKKMLMVK